MHNTYEDLFHDFSTEQVQGEALKKSGENNILKTLHMESENLVNNGYISNVLDIILSGVVISICWICLAKVSRLLLLL